MTLETIELQDVIKEHGLYDLNKNPQGYTFDPMSFIDEETRSFPPFTYDGIEFKSGLMLDFDDAGSLPEYLNIQYISSNNSDKGTEGLSKSLAIVANQGSMWDERNLKYRRNASFINAEVFQKIPNQTAHYKITPTTKNKVKKAQVCILPALIDLQLNQSTYSIFYGGMQIIVLEENKVELRLSINHEAPDFSDLVIHVSTDRNPITSYITRG